MRNGESKSGVTFARVFTSELAVHPHGDAVVDSLKLNADSEGGPEFGNVEIASIPGDAAILSERRLDLPGVRNVDDEPIGCGNVGCEPVVPGAGVFGIGAEEPFAAEADRFGWTDD